MRIVFVDFPSAFNTIQPALQCEKLQRTQMDASAIAWIIDYLTNKQQFVRLKSCVSDRVVSGTGASHGTVLSPFPFTLSTSDFHCNSLSCHVQKYVGWDVSAVDERLSTENWWTTLWDGIRTTTQL